MTCVDENTYDYNPNLDERTEGFYTHEATLDWNERFSWFRMAEPFGGPQDILTEQFTLVVVGSAQGVQKRFTFSGFMFRDHTRATYMTVG